MYKQIIIIITILAFQLVFVCESPKSKENIHNKPKKEKIMNQKVDNSIIFEWLNLREVKLKSLILEETTIVKNVKYEGLKNLTRVNLINDNSKYYFFDGAENCVMIYFNNESELSKLSIEGIVSTFGEPEEIVRSRAGKRANHNIYSKNGFAYSKKDGKIIFFEVFPDCSIEDYIKNIYIKPLKYKR